jgi:predicted TIM-barrel fold metal-dependent hydrolase
MVDRGSIRCLEPRHETSAAGIGAVRSLTRPSFTDAHVHFFDRREPRLRYEWLRPGGDPEETAFLGDYAAMRAERYWADDFAAETRFQNVDRVVHVQAALGIDDPVEETRWLEGFRARIGIPHAIVAYVDLSDGEVREVLDRHLAASSVVRGVRDLRYDDYLENPAWEAGFALLEEYGLVACNDPLLEHAAGTAAIAARHPGITYCLDHALTPRRRDSAYFDEWREALGRLAAVPSTVIKISGLGMGDHAWTVDSLRPWVLACIEAFGAERSFFGTN